LWVRQNEGESARALAAAYDNVAQARDRTDAARAVAADVNQVLDRLKSTPPATTPAAAASPASKSSPASPAAVPTPAPQSNTAIQEAEVRLAAAKDGQARAEATQAEATRALSLLREHQDSEANRLMTENQSIHMAIPFVAVLFLLTAIVTYREVAAIERSLRDAQAAARRAQEELRVKQARLNQEESVATKTLELAAETLRAAHERMQSERFARATESLDRDKPLSVRLGAIYSLERLMKDMTSLEDRGAALKVLTAYLREHRPESEPTDLPTDASQPEQGSDIQAVVSVFRQWKRNENDPAIDLRGAWLPHVWLGGADLGGAFLDRANLQRANLIKAHLRGASLMGAELNGAYMSGADLREADLSEATLSEADLAGANLNRAELRGADLAGANLSGVDLSGADLSEADLSGANLSGAILKGADLRKAFLIQVNFKGAHLIGAKLYDADLSGVNLSEANLSEADLGGADLRFTLNLTQEQIDAAVTNARTQVTPPLTVTGAVPRVAIAPTSSNAPSDALARPNLPSNTNIAA
jgi:uncharacterized protein YjbI with pentapeptide repeats